MIDLIDLIELVRMTGVPMLLLLIVAMVLKGQVMTRRQHDDIVHERDTELQFWRDKTVEYSKLSKQVAMNVQRRPAHQPSMIDRKVPQRPPSFPTNKPLTPLQVQKIRDYVRIRMHCQGVSIPGRPPIEWATEDGLRRCLLSATELPAKPLALPSKPSDPGGDEYEWVEVTRLGDGEKVYVIGRKIDAYAPRYDWIDTFTS